MKTKRFGGTLECDVLHLNQQKIEINPNQKEKEYLVDRQTNITYCTAFVHALKSCDRECEPNAKVDIAPNITIIINHSVVEKLG